jgi:hypothetical protein
MTCHLWAMMKCKLNIQLIFKTLSYFYWCIKCIGTGYLNSIQVPNLLPCQLFPSFFKTSLQLSQQIPWNEIKLKQIEWNSKTKLTLPSTALAYIHITLHIALHSTTYIPVKWGDIFVARHFSSTLLNAMTNNKLSWWRRVFIHVPNSGSTITRARSQ